MRAGCVRAAPETDRFLLHSMARFCQSAKYPSWCYNKCSEDWGFTSLNLWTYSLSRVLRISCAGSWDCHCCFIIEYSFCCLAYWSLSWLCVCTSKSLQMWTRLLWSAPPRKMASRSWHSALFSISTKNWSLLTSDPLFLSCRTGSSNCNTLDR